MDLRLVATLPLPTPKTPADLKASLALIVPTPVPQDLTIEFLPPSSLSISYTQSFPDVTDAAQTLFTLITVSWPTFINSVRKPPLEP